MKTIVRYLMILPLIAAASCLREPFEDFAPNAPDNEKDVTFKLAIPFTAPQGPATRSIGAAQENAIESLDVLAFKVESGGNETFQYRTEARKVAGNNGGEPSQTFTAKLLVKDYDQRFVFITNAKDKIKNLIDSHVDGFVGEEKESMLGQLTFEPRDGDRWKAISNAEYTAIPMWGETAPKKISPSTPSVNDGQVSMLRMIAKVDVQLDTENHPKLASAFKLKSVHVYNANSLGRIVPKPGTDYVGADMKAKKASLPNDPKPIKNPLFYDGSNTQGVTDAAMKGAIYLFETAAKNAGNPLEETGIVVGGEYGTEGKTTYYRLDFSGQDDKKHMDVLRNHMYIFKITKVDGHGHDSPEDAYSSQSYNMATKLITWDMGGIRDIVFDNQYMLGVSHNRFDFDGNARDENSADNILKITTDHPDGWKASVWADKEGKIPVPQTNGKPWINLSRYDGVGGAQTAEVRLTIQENAADPRTAFVHIKAGKLSYIVTVVQEKALPGTITVTPAWILLPYTKQKPAQQFLTVHPKKFNGDDDPNATWTLSVPASDTWLTLSLNADGSGDKTSVSGKGKQYVYLVASENPNTNPREIIIQMGTHATDVVKVVQTRNPGKIDANNGAGDAPSSRTYVGAFWRAKETGERLIRIKSDDTGEWTASVIWMDDRWGGNDGIVLDTEEIDDVSLAARGISFSSDMIPDKPENHQLSGYASAVSGEVDNGYIFFRIGLKSEYKSSEKYPARYAVVLLSYAGNTKHQKLFLRQGHEPDYLMMNGEEFHPDSDLKPPYNIRTNSSKFAVYNLTAKTLNEQVGKRGAIFTEYPTQAGALWQCGTNISNVDLIRMAYSPLPESSSQTWPGFVNSDQFWNALMDDNEVSPEGFRRPTDGRINLNEDFPSGSFAAIMQSEMRQSLFWNVRNGVNVHDARDTKNSIWGYYADGFFDRRKTYDGASHSERFYSNTTVARDQEYEIAHIGRLFFNPIKDSDRYNASLFFPAAGWVVTPNPTDPAFSVNWGCDASYWSSSASHTHRGNEGLSIRIMDTWALPFTHPKSALVSIRPVAAE